eukprot:gene7745-gene8481
MVAVTAPEAMNVRTAAKERGENRERPHRPWPDVHPDPNRVPYPTNKPAVTMTGID